MFRSLSFDVRVSNFLLNSGARRNTAAATASCWLRRKIYVATRKLLYKFINMSQNNVCKRCIPSYLSLSLSLIICIWRELLSWWEFCGRYDLNHRVVRTSFFIQLKRFYLKFSYILSYTNLHIFFLDYFQWEYISFLSLYKFLFSYDLYIILC